MPTYTAVHTRFTGKGSKNIYEWAQLADGDAGTFFALVFGYDYENATEKDWDDWEYDFDSYRLGNAMCGAHMEKDNSVGLSLDVIGSIPYGVFKKIAERFPSIHADGRFLQEHEEFFGNIVIENGGFLWTKFDNPERRSGKKVFSFWDSFFREQEEESDMDQEQKEVLELLKIDRDNMRTLLAEGKGFFRLRDENKHKALEYHSDFYFSEHELKAIAGDADCQYQIAQELLEHNFFNNNPRIYNKRDRIERECSEQYFYEMGQSWLEKAAMNGNPDAQYQIAKAYLDDEKDEEAKGLFMFSLQNGSEEALAEAKQWELFEYDEEVLSVFEKMASQGSIDAMKVLMNHYEEIGDNQKFLKWLKKAADCEDAYSMWALAKNLIEVHESHRDIEKAIDMLEKCSALGMSESTNYLAQIYAYGELVEKDVIKTLKYMEKAVADDILKSVDSAKYLLACSECGIYSSQYIPKILEFRSSIFNSYNLAECFSGEDRLATALGIKRDSAKYIELLNVAAQNGSGGAIFRLGKAYYEGEHIEKDFKKSFEYFLLCNKNYSESQYYLGLMYLNGEYVPKNLFMAEKWLSNGSKTGSLKARELLKTVKKQIKTEQLVLDKETIAQMKDFEKAVLLVSQKKYDQAIAKLYLLGDFLDSRQRIEDTIPLFRLQFDDLMSNHMFIKARESLDLIPRDSDNLNKLWEELNDRLKESIKHKKFVVGEKGPAGGIIVYAKEEASDGWQYMEAATNAVSYRTWGNLEKLVTGTAIGSGKDNTYKIVAENEGKETAAQVCLEYEQGGFKDWFLPSKDELFLLITSRYLNRRGEYYVDYFKTKAITSSSKANDYNVWGMPLSIRIASWNPRILGLSRNYTSIKCIPFRVF